MNDRILHEVFSSFPQIISREILRTNIKAPNAVELAKLLTQYNQVLRTAVISDIITEENFNDFFEESAFNCLLAAQYSAHG